ncbi:alpha-N-arabinofuranosidase [uncultured Paludibaculum sp.]|uniref:alpha-N-arabinofuranosidase n=1 Tax=uncultured Paludibaculum sp. TaxID=1765020 RepID=UPI002AAAE9E2|nr:alpha-N-arabinofuranosidase [uncultured Paludibaculum sp.]
MSTRIFLAILASALPALGQQPLSADLTIRAGQPGPQVNRQIFGQFAEHLGAGIYGGIWVGEDSKIPNTRGYRNDVLQALRDLKVPVIRWPGGCFADEYNWREGVGPRAKRPVKINTHWGGVTEPNSFGTHEFLNFAELVGAEPYISGNVGSAPPRELAEWVEYVTSPAGSLANERAANGRKDPWKLPYIGLGNELWGCGGNMRAEYAADVTRRYSTFIKVPAGVKILKSASGPSDEDYNWMEVMMRDAGRHFDAIGLHYYTITGTWAKKGSATVFDEAEYAKTLQATLRMDGIITRHAAIMDKYDPQKRVWLAVDEWGTWFDTEPGTNPGFLYQQSTLRDALVAALNINIFTKHADRIKMANIAQMINVLQAMILTKDDKMILTPTYHVFEMFKSYQDATALPLDIKSPWYNQDASTMPAVSASAVRGKDGRLHIGLVNVDPNHAVAIKADLLGATVASVTGRVLTAPAINSHNTFEQLTVVKPAAFTGASIESGALKAVLPPKSVVVLDLQ